MSGKARLMDEIGKALVRLGADDELMSIVYSVWETNDEYDAADLLEAYNQKKDNEKAV